MSALYSLSSCRLLSVAAAAILAGALAWEIGGGAVEPVALVAELVALAVVVAMAAILHRVVAALGEVARTAEAIARSGDFSRRIAAARSRDAEALRHSVNHLIDVTDAFVREAGASMQHVGR